MAVKKIAIFGATGNTGLTTLAQAVQAGMELGRAGSVMVDPQDWGQCVGWGGSRPSLPWCGEIQMAEVCVYVGEGLLRDPVLCDFKE